MSLKAQSDSIPSLGQFDVFEGDGIRGRNPLTDFFYDLWLAKGGAKGTISRADISPHDMKKYLEHVVLIDIQGEADDWSLFVRLMGSHATHFFGNITGQDVRALENKSTVHRLYLLAERIIDSGQPVMVKIPGYSPDLPYKEAVGIYLPLFGPSGAVTKILIAVDVVNRDDDFYDARDPWGLPLHT